MDGPFARPGLREGQAWRWGVTGVGSAGYRCRNMRGLILCCPTQARVANRSSAFPFRVYVTCHQSLHSLTGASIIRWCGFRPRTAPCHRRAAFVAFWTYSRPLYTISSSFTCLARSSSCQNRYVSILDGLASKNRRKRITQALGHGREGRV